MIDIMCEKLYTNKISLSLFILVIFIFPMILFSQSERKDQLTTNSSILPISVTIGGNFVVNGTFPAGLNERVDQFVSRIISQSGKSTEGMEAIFTRAEKYPRRGIVLKRANGETVNLDLEKFRLSGDFKYNPYLRNDDVLIFPKLEGKDFIIIEGAVNRSCSFQFLEGDKIEDAILFAQGINPNYVHVEQAEIYRLTFDGKMDTVIKRQINQEFTLRRGDRIKFIGVESLKKNYKAFIEGQVKQPGVIYLPKDGMSLASVIKQAGGLREDADLYRAELIRGANVFQSLYYGYEFETIMMQRMANIMLEDSVNFMIDNKLRMSRGAIASSLAGSRREEITSVEITINEGDYLFIPKKIEMVYVFGQVNNFGYVKYEHGKDYNFYIEQAGGLGVTATSDVYLIKNRTRAWYLITEKKVEIEPGDFIWIPKQPLRDFDYYLQRISYIGSIVTGIATTVLLFIQVTK